MIDMTEFVPIQQHPRYQIDSIADFFKVPADRRERCMYELRAALAHIETINESFGADVASLSQFTWIDDGEEHADVTLVLGRDVIFETEGEGG